MKYYLKLEEFDEIFPCENYRYFKLSAGELHRSVEVHGKTSPFFKGFREGYALEAMYGYKVFLESGDTVYTAIRDNKLNRKLYPNNPVKEGMVLIETN